MQKHLKQNKAQRRSEAVLCIHSDMAESICVFIGSGKRNSFYYVWRRRVFIFLLAVELRKIEGLLTGVRSGNRNSISSNMWES